LPPGSPRPPGQRRGLQHHRSGLGRQPDVGDGRTRTAARRRRVGVG
jgi:hypothetical protein